MKPVWPNLYNCWIWMMGMWGFSVLLFLPWVDLQISTVKMYFKSLHISVVLIWSMSLPESVAVARMQTSNWSHLKQFPTPELRMEPLSPAASPGGNQGIITRGSVEECTINRCLPLLIPPHPTMDMAMGKLMEASFYHSASEKHLSFLPSSPSLF